MSNTSKRQLSKAIAKQRVNAGEIITLPRKTRSDISNVNGYAYTHEAFEDAMKTYVVYKGGKVYLSPVTITDEDMYGLQKLYHINNVVYANFNILKEQKEQYYVGKVISWDEYTMDIQLEPTILTKNFLKYISQDTNICMRYKPLCKYSKTEPIYRMCITLIDLPVIPFDILGVDIKKILEEDKK